MHKLSLVDETFDSNLTFEYHLSIQIDLDGFCFSILDSIQNKVIYLFYQELFDNKPEFVLKHLESIYKESDLLNFNYKQTSIILANSVKQQLIPSDIFINKSIEQYQQVAFQKTDEEHTEYFTLKEFNQQLILSSPKAIRSFLAEKHPQAIFTTNLGCWEKQISSSSSLNTAFIHISKRYVSIILCNDKGFTSFNTYPWYYESDLLYFILGNIKNQDITIDQITLSGIVNRFSYIFHQLKSYFKKVQIIDRPEKIDYSYLLEKLPDARFIDLFNNLTI